MLKQVFVTDNITICCSPKIKETYTLFIEDLQKHFIVKNINNHTKNSPILLIGGDGSLNYIINQLEKMGLANDENPILYFPAGTANDFSKSLGIIETDPTVKKVKDILQKNSLIRVPLMKCNDKYFINVLTAGAPAKVTDSGTSMLKKLTGQFSYYLQALEEIISPSLYSISYSVDDSERVKVETYGFTVAQGLYAGGGVKVSSSYSPHFGKSFDFTIPKSQNMSSVLASIIEIQKDEPDLTSSHLDIFKCTNLEIEAKNEIEIKLDGEDYKSKNLTIKKSSKSLPFYTH